MADSIAGSPPLAGDLSGDPELARQVDEARREHLLLDPRPLPEMADTIFRPMNQFTPAFWLAFLVLGGGALMMIVVWLYQAYTGLGIVGISRPTMWEPYLVNYIYFIGIGNAGTFISAVLRALHFEWRAPISRVAETLTVFAMATASLFPLIHVGRVWKLYWTLPLPNMRQLWPNFRSPLTWDVVAIVTYLICSVLFAWLGLLPDLATARDRFPSGVRHRFYDIASLGWRGTDRQWSSQKLALDVFTFAIIPVMFLMHTIVAWDFAMILQPGWHSTVFGPYFVVGALFSGVAMVIIILMAVSKLMGLRYFIRAEHLDAMGKFLLIMSFAWTYFIFNDYLAPWFGQAPADKSMMLLLQNLWASPLWYTMLFCNIAVPALLLTLRRLRRTPAILLIAALSVQIGMWLERFIIVPVMMGINDLPYSWGKYTLRLPETLITIGAFCLVGFLFLLFTRVFPVIPLWEVHEGQQSVGLKHVGRVVVRTHPQPE
jgi:Ni/Fe-hydrogenase subunit HybB-like protein